MHRVQQLPGAKGWAGRPQSVPEYGAAASDAPNTAAPTATLLPALAALRAACRANL